MNHTPEPRYSARSTTPHSWRVFDSWNNEAIAFCDDREAASRIAGTLNALAGLNPDAVAGVVAALEEIKSARDYYAQEGVYPEKIHVQYQCCFDDWAADLADDALAAFRGEVQQ